MRDAAVNPPSGVHWDMSGVMPLVSPESTAEESPSLGRRKGLERECRGSSKTLFQFHRLKLSSSERSGYTSSNISIKADRVPSGSTAIFEKTLPGSMPVDFS